MYFTSSGEYRQSKVYLVCGAPASGKSTYVDQHKKDGDLIVDLDLLRQALGAPHKTSQLFTELLLAIRETIYKEIVAEHINCENIWVISGLADSDERQRTAHRLNAEIVFINTPYEECLRRAENDSTRKDKVTQKYIINKYFDKLT